MLTETYPAVPGAADRRTVSYTFDAAGSAQHNAEAFDFSDESRERNRFL